MQGGRITATQAACNLSSTLNYVYQLARVGKLRGHKRDGVWWIEADSVTALIANRRQKKVGNSRKLAEAAASTAGEESLQNSA